MAANPKLAVVDTIPWLDEDADAFLDELEIHDAHQDLPMPVKPFWVTTDFELSRMLERAQATQAELDRLTRLAEDRIQDIRDWLAHESARHNRRLAFYQTEAQLYGLQRLEESGKRSVKVSVPEGTIVAKYQEPEYEVDHARLGRCLAAMGLHEYVTREVKVGADWAAVKKLAQTPAAAPGAAVAPTLGGMALDGVTAKPRPPKAEVTLA